MNHTPGPWAMGEFDDTGGYDCMTGGVRAGPAVLDGAYYGQHLCEKISPYAKDRMLADAALIAAAPDLLAALEECADRLSSFGLMQFVSEKIDPIIAKARGKS